ncbi:MAG: DHH family phosphoesterase [Spirochaetes bacterium]|nr:DHH family phosphoesterase [Spirochaetota bacterium]
MTIANELGRGRFLSTIERSRNIYITTHINPDPDAIACAFGMQYLLKKALRRKSVIIQSGVIGRAENKALISECGIKSVDASTVTVTSDDCLILLDAQHVNSNYPFRRSVRPEIVIDHHPLRAPTYTLPFYDIRPRYGATAEILVEYFKQFGIPFSRAVATALYYGIKTDTANWSRSTGHDIAVCHSLAEHIDDKMLSRIEYPELPVDYYRQIHKGLTTAVRYGSIITVHLHALPSPDYASLIADFFLRAEDVHWVFVTGRLADAVIFSLRCTRARENAGDVIKALVGKQGSGGGHSNSAAGKIPTAGLTEAELEKIEHELVAKLLKRLHGRIIVGDLFIDTASNRTV